MRCTRLEVSSIASLQKQNILLAKRIEESTKNLARLYEDLRTVYMRTIRVLAQAIDARDHFTHDHSENVAKYAVAIARQMGMTVKEIEMIRDASYCSSSARPGAARMTSVPPCFWASSPDPRGHLIRSGAETAASCSPTIASRTCT